MVENGFGNKNKNDLFSFIYERFYDRVYKAVYFMTRDSYVTEDIVQETFIKAFKKISTIEDEKKVGPWLSTIATRTAIDFIRKEKRKNEIPIEDDVLMNKVFNTELKTVEQEVEMIFFKEDLSRNLNHLKPEYRQVLELKYKHELKEEEIISQLQLNKATVKSRLYRARKKLKTVIAN